MRIIIAEDILGSPLNQKFTNCLNKADAVCYNLFSKFLSISHDGELRMAFKYRLMKATASQYRLSYIS